MKIDDSSQLESSKAFSRGRPPRRIAYESPVLQPNLCFTSPQKVPRPPADRPPEPLQIMPFYEVSAVGASHSAYESPVLQNYQKLK